MSVVIIGGNMSGNLKTQIGQPDLFILFASAVAHKMVYCALKEAERHSIPGERAHSSSACALESVLEKVVTSA